MRNKKYIVAGTIVAAIAAVGIITLSSISLAFTSNMEGKLETLDGKLDKAIGTTEDVAQEDDVLIAGEYTVLSTKKLSDAYIDGTVEDLDDIDKETVEMADKVIKEIVTDNMTDYEKELAVYEWMIENLKIDESGMASIQKEREAISTPYGVLKAHKAICVGYATTFRLFMQMMKIECKVVHSTDLFHSWNAVKLDDDWYFVDVYSDAGIGNYANFNLNDIQCAEGHEWNREFFPAAAGTKYNYACLNSEKETNVYNIPKKIRKAIDDKKKNLFLNLGNNFSDHSREVVELMMSYIVDYTMEELNVSYKWVENDSEEQILSIYLSVYDDMGMSDLPEAEIERINNVIMKAFSDYTSGGMTE